LKAFDSVYGVILSKQKNVYLIMTCKVGCKAG